MNIDRNHVVVKISGVTKWKPYEKLLLDRIALEVRQSQSVLIWGEEGSGTEELLSIIIGAQRPDEGTVEIQGKPGIVPKNFPMTDFGDVTDYMMIPLLMKGREKKQTWKFVCPLLKNSLLWEKRGVQVKYLDGFEKNYLMVLMAYTLQPDFLVIGNCRKHMTREDEEMFWQAVGELVRQNGTALVCLADSLEIPYDFDYRYRLFDAKLMDAAIY